MSAGAPHEHWLDRLAAPHTRRQGFKAMLAGAALTLPFAHAETTGATNSCTRGCNTTSHRRYAAEFGNCPTSDTFAYTGVLLGLFVNPFYGLAFEAAAHPALTRCRDRALLAHKERQFDCKQPGCPNFDPAGEYGPCVNCASINGCQCCADSTAPDGYTYCDNLIGKCCGINGGCVNCGSRQARAHL